MDMPNDVVVLTGDEGVATPQPETFRCCPLGVQFYSKQKLAPYRILDVQLAFPDENGGQPVHCSGVVVHCRKVHAEELYRVWVMFSDLSKELRSKLACVSNKAQVKCPHCENF